MLSDSVSGMKPGRPLAVVIDAPAMVRLEVVSRRAVCTSAAGPGPSPSCCDSDSSSALVAAMARPHIFPGASAPTTGDTQHAGRGVHVALASGAPILRTRRARASGRAQNLMRALGCTPTKSTSQEASRTIQALSVTQR